MPEQPIIIKKKKVSGHGGHHGGSWKVAYADFVTAMMAFFMVMWIMGLSDSDKSQISGYFNDPMGFMKTPPRSKSVFSIKSAMPPKAQSKLTGNIGAGKDGDKEALQKAKERADHRKEGSELASKIERSIEGVPSLKNLMKNIEFEITKEGIRIEFVESTGSVFFESGSYAIRPQARLLVAKIAPLLKASKRPMIVEGHTDSKPYAGQMFDNFDLSTLRAVALRRALASNGINSRSFLAVRGLADTELKIPGKPFDFRNRRVTLLLPWSKTRPTVVDTHGYVKDGVTASFSKTLQNAPPPIQIVPKPIPEEKGARDAGSSDDHAEQNVRIPLGKPEPKREAPAHTAASHH